jgi:ATP-dependent Clp protease ATP-binding subunit ClpA
VVLFDEIEKAHQDVFNVLLQIMDDGRLTDGHGRTVDFKNTVIIMTSNLGSDLIRRDTALGFGTPSDQTKFQEQSFERMKAKVMDEVKRFFRPEFLNRVDEAIIFHPLGKDHLKEIVGIQLWRLQQRLAERHIGLRLTDEAKDLVIEAGYDPVYGARPLKRTIQQKILDPLAMRVLSGEFREGDSVLVEVEGDGLVFKREAKVGVAA